MMVWLVSVDGAGSDKKDRTKAPGPSLA